MKMNFKTASLLIMMQLLFISNVVLSQSGNTVKLGVYYFDGWNSMSDFHITKSLVNDFPERESKWGWITSTTPAMKEQIDLAADAGLSFFSFCWYYQNAQTYMSDPVNHAVQLYLNSPNNSRIQFNLIVCDDGRYQFGPTDWPFLENVWIQMFKKPQYLKVYGKPYILFSNVESLITHFGSTMAVKQALDKLRRLAASEGLSGVTFGACVYPDIKGLQNARDCGIDILTGYNYHATGFKPFPKIPNSPMYPTQAIPIKSLLNSDTIVWNRITLLSHIPYIPPVTLNWDPRPWNDNTNHYDTAPYYVGFSPSSVYTSVSNLIYWIKTHSSRVAENIGMVEAWNEYGEGSWLTPTKSGDNSKLKSVAAAIRNQ
jgi:hypothetical protein